MMLYQCMEYIDCLFLYLKREHGLFDLTELQKKTADVTVKYHELSEKIKSAEARMKEISETKTHAKSIEIHCAKGGIVL